VARKSYVAMEEALEQELVEDEALMDGL